ncbi:MAG: N-acetylmuramoyl-L-alanine amidase, partial [Limisphaerales bacterium]
MKLRPVLMLSIGVALGGEAFAGQGPQPSICTRSCWGARAPKCSLSQMSALNRAIIHHTAGASDFNTTGLENSKTIVRGVQNLHMDSNGWCDIAYHFLVDKHGNIFEGRSGSMSSLPKGSHDGHNLNSFGFTLLGYFHPPYNHQAPWAMRDAIYDVIA